MEKIAYNTIDGNLQQLDGGRLDVESIYSKEFIESLNKKADQAKWTSDYINEIYLYFLLNVIENAEAMRKNGIKKINIRIFRPSWTVFVASSRAADIYINKNVAAAYQVTNLILLIGSFVLIMISSLVLPIWVLITRKGEELSSYNNISLIRTSASYSKMRYLEEAKQTKFYFDDIIQGFSSGQSMYAHGNKYQRILLPVLIPYMVLKDCFSIIRDSRALLGRHQAGFVLSYYTKRVAHKCVFEYFLDIIIKKNSPLVY